MMTNTLKKLKQNILHSYFKSPGQQYTVFLVPVVYIGFRSKDDHLIKNITSSPKIIFLFPLVKDLDDHPLY